jgi:hypothetical protein
MGVPAGTALRLCGGIKSVKILLIRVIRVPFMFSIELLNCEIAVKEAG